MGAGSIEGSNGERSKTERSETSSVDRIGPFLGRLIDRFAWLILRYWKRIYLLGLTVFVALPLLAPVLAMRGETRWSGAIYSVYRLTCHQLPHHSFFLGGEQRAYSWAEVQPHTEFGIDEAPFAFHHPLRAPDIGYQLAFCQRDTAIWLSLWLASMFLVMRARRAPLRPIRMRTYFLLLVPIAVDGLTQLVGLRESTPFLRSITGAVFGVATALLVVPLLDEGMREALMTEGSAPRPESS
jgi:uncharacterized membrane protein